MEAFAERARRELAATGETAHKRTVEARDTLTPQEAQIAGWPAAASPTPRSPPSCSSARAPSPTTCGKVFTKLGISSRLQLRRALPDDANTARLASGPVTRNPPL